MPKGSGCLLERSSLSCGCSKQRDHFLVLKDKVISTRVKIPEKYAKKTNCIVVTVDRPFVSRLRASGIQAVALDMNDRSRIINEKLEKI